MKHKYIHYLIYVAVLGMSAVIGCSTNPVKKHDCFKDDGPAYCKAKEQPGWWKR